MTKLILTIAAAIIPVIIQVLDADEKKKESEKE
jgi:hypothetical protein